MDGSSPWSSTVLVSKVKAAPCCSASSSICFINKALMFTTAPTCHSSTNVPGIVRACQSLLPLKQRAVLDRRVFFFRVFHVVFQIFRIFQICLVCMKIRRTYLSPLVDFNRGGNIGNALHSFNLEKIKSGKSGSVKKKRDNLTRKIWKICLRQYKYNGPNECKNHGSRQKQMDRNVSRVGHITKYLSIYR